MVRRFDFGRLGDGRLVEGFDLGSPGGLQARVLTYGANLAALWVPVGAGRRNVVLGHESPDGYAVAGHAHGAVMGRYANRIAGGRFTLDGRLHQLDINRPPYTIHGGSMGFSKRVWSAEADRDGVVLKLASADGDQGFPGTLDVTVRYGLEGAALSIDYGVVTDVPTIVNLTNHAYFNLAGGGGILDHRVSIAADRFAVADLDQVPTGELRAVAGTPFDLRTPQRVGDRIDADHQQLKAAGGYDHHFVLADAMRDQALLAATCEAGGIVMAVETSEPGVQFYTANMLGGPHGPRSGLCFETQHPADSPNHENFPSTILRPGQRFASRTNFRFTTVQTAGDFRRAN